MLNSSKRKKGSVSKDSLHTASDGKKYRTQVKPILKSGEILRTKQNVGISRTAFA